MVSEALQYTALWFLSFNLLGNCMSLFADRIAASLTALSGDGRDLKRALKQQIRNRESEPIAADQDDGDEAASAPWLGRRLHEDNVRIMQKALDGNACCTHGSVEQNRPADADDCRGWRPGRRTGRLLRLSLSCADRCQMSVVYCRP